MVLRTVPFADTLGARPCCLEDAAAWTWEVLMKSKLALLSGVTLALAFAIHPRRKIKESGRPKGS